MKQENIRNIAIIAHVDHGKTTLVDRLLHSSGVFRDNQDVPDCVLDSNDQERERGITILSKNVSIRYKGVKINVIDTPGHADFGGEVERVLNMADGCLLIVDAFEGPMPQTRFVLKHALALGLKPLVVINKIDRPGARPIEVLDEIFDLMVDLDATSEQLDFPVIYASAVEGYARLEPDDDNMDIFPLLDAILEYIPAPEVDPEGPLAMQVCTINHSPYVGRIAVGRIFSGSLKKNDQILVLKQAGGQENAQVKNLMTFEALGQVDAALVEAGDIAAVIGIDGIGLGDVITSKENPVPMDPIEIDEPTMSIVFEASTSPFLAKEGDIVGSRQLKERLQREAESNVSLRIEELEGGGTKVSGRGVLHLSVLMESMRREGYEFQVGCPEIIYRKDEKGKLLEPYEEATVEIPSEYAGKAIELLSAAGGEMKDMVQRGDQTHLVFAIPTRGIMGLNTRLMNASRGEAIFSHRFDEYLPAKGEMPRRKNGVMIANETGPSVAYALDTLQTHGIMFIGPGVDCYEGMIVGEHAKEIDLVVNPCKSKQLTNTRAAGSDKAIILTPPTIFTLEECLEYIEDDELLEVTPLSLRMRKRILTEVGRRKAKRTV